VGESGRILVTGATGGVGGEVLRQLHASGHAVVGATRDPGAMRCDDSTQWVAFDFARPSTYEPAFTGTERVFLMRPPAISDVKRVIGPAIQAAASAGVRQVVFLSLQGVEHNTWAPHYSVERMLESSGMAWTFVRPSFFMQNLITEHGREIRERSELCVPAGRGKTAFVDTRDVAAVAVAALTRGESLFGQTPEITGAESLDYYQVAAILSEELGRPIRYRRPGALAFVYRKLREGVPLGKTVVMTLIYTVARLGKASHLSPDTERILGRLPISLRAFVHEHRAVWATANA
jgi:uncharacterized protein YbjT (DUF2867 family)